MDRTCTKEEQHSKETQDMFRYQKFSPVTSRYIKKHYKISLADFINQNDAREKNFKTSNVEENHRFIPNEYDIDCPRCFMIQTGSLLVSQNIKCITSVMMPPGRQDLYELADMSEEGDEFSEPSDGENISDDGHTIMAIAASVAAGSDIASRVNLLNEGPAKMINERRIMEPPKLELAQHACLVMKANINDTAMITISGKPSIKSELPVLGKILHTVIYAPSGTGKTEFQRRLAAQGYLIYDTDDIPGVNPGELEGILQKGSVITNRLDLLQFSPRVIAFLPNTADDLRRHTEAWKLTDADYEHWYKCHQNVRLPENAVVIHYSKTYVSEWFVETQKSPPGRTVRGVEKDILEYIRYHEEAMLSKSLKGRNSTSN